MEMISRTTLKEWIKDYGSNILTSLASNVRIDNYPLTKALINTTDAPTLDYDYNSRSSCKLISNLLINIKDDATLDTIAKRMQVVTNLILIKYGNNWERELLAFTKDYNPIDNYNMEENENVGTDVVIDTDGSNNVYGFNTSSDDGVPSDKNAIKQTTTGDFTKNKRKLTRSGNIGVTTSAQMIIQELDMRTKYNLLNMIYANIDELLTLAYRSV